MSRLLRAAYPTYNPSLQTVFEEAQLSRTDAYSKGPSLAMTVEVIFADAQTLGSRADFEEPVRRGGLCVPEAGTVISLTRISLGCCAAEDFQA